MSVTPPLLLGIRQSETPVPGDSTKKARSLKRQRRGPHGFRGSSHPLVGLPLRTGRERETILTHEDRPESNFVSAFSFFGKKGFEVHFCGVPQVGGRISVVRREGLVSRVTFPIGRKGLGEVSVTRMSSLG